MTSDLYDDMREKQLNVHILKEKLKNIADGTSSYDGYDINNDEAVKYIKKSIEYLEEELCIIYGDIFSRKCELYDY